MTNMGDRELENCNQKKKKNQKDGGSLFILQWKPKWRNQAHVQLCKIFRSTVISDPEYC